MPATKDTRQAFPAALLRKAVTQKYAKHIELQAERRAALKRQDICDWAEEHFYIPSTEKPIVLSIWQKGIIRLALKKDPDGRFHWSTLLYGTVKKSGKSTIAGMIARWMAETQTRFGEIFAVGNTFRQARDRAFKECRFSIELTPGYIGKSGVLPGRWDVHPTFMVNHLTGSRIEPVAMNAAGEAGGHPALSIWTELWGFEHEDAKRMWDEMTRDPTQPNSIRLVETYAGYDGESELLYNLYTSATQDGRQLSNHEFAMAACRQDVPGESYNDFLYAFAETNGDPAAKVPIFYNEPAGLFGYWDHGQNARRFDWQNEQYYREEEATLPAKAYRRLHFNEWVGAESDFVPIELWDACQDQSLPPLEPDEMIEFDGEVPLGQLVDEALQKPRRRRGQPAILALDAAATADCFAAVLVTRHPADHTIPAIRQVKVWHPEDFPSGHIDFEQAETWIRSVCAMYNVVQITYDPYQLEDMMQRLYRERVAWCNPFNQGAERGEADRGLHDRIMTGSLSHNGDPTLRQHILNVNSKLQPDQDSKMRMVKKSTGRKIDAAVAASMGVARCMYLNI